MKSNRVVVLLVVLVLLAAACGRDDDDPSSAAPTSNPPAGNEQASAIEEACASEPLEATEVGVSAEEITISVMADTGSPLAPGIFQGNVDAVVAFADYINEHGGVGCRQLVVRTWDSKFDPAEAKNGHIDACRNAFAMVGGNSVFNPDPSSLETCADLAGEETGVPNVAAFAVDTAEMCSPMTVGINARAEACPVRAGEERAFERMVGPMRWLLERHPGLHGVYLANGDLPSTRVSAIPDIAVQEQAGIVFDAKLVQSAVDPQTSYVPRVGYLKRGSNYVYNGSGDYALVFMMKEAAAQGVDDSVVWACNVACYTQSLLSSGGDAVEGAYVWVQALPFDEADTNPTLDAYVTTVGLEKVDTWGVQSWQAAVAFQQVVDQLVVDEGPNAITRAALLAGLRSLEGFSADGMTGPHRLGEASPCYVMLQVRDGAFERVWPEERGSFDCDESNLATVEVNPERAAETDLQ